MIVNCVAYQNGRKLADIAPEQISDYVTRADTFVWVALADPARDEMLAMAEEFSLHPLAREDALKGHQRPKIEEYDGCVFVVLHAIESVIDQPGQVHVGEVHVFVGRNYVLSIRHQTQRGFSDVRARAEREPDLLKFGSSYVLYALIDAVVDRYFPVVDALTNELESLEESLFEESDATSRHKIRDLYALKRRLMVLRHAVSPLMEAVGKLYGGRVPQYFVGMGDYYRDVYDHLARIAGSIDNIREMLTTAISVNIALISLAESEVTKRLAAWGALITVPTLVAGIYGMNFRHMPELEWVSGYPFALMLMLLIDALLFWRFRKVGWV